MNTTVQEQAEFDRLKNAKRGTLRLERKEEYVIIAHIYSYTELPLTHMKWYITIYRDNQDKKVIRTEFTSDLTFDQLNQWIDRHI